MRIGENHTPRRELVEVWSLDLAAQRVQALHVTIAKIVGKDIQDVWLGLGSV